MKNKKFRKKPVIIEACQTDVEVIIHTLEGDMIASPGDWIITGVAGEQYPCKPDIFERTYGPINEIELERKDGKMKVKTIGIKYVKDGMKKIEILSGGDWLDLRIAEDVDIKAGEFKLIPLGVAIMLPKGYEALIIPRSSTFKKYGIIQANSVGLIDESYCGNNDEWHFPAFATRDIKIPKNTRICQFRIIEHQPPLILEEVPELSSTDRGGFGSTGEI